MTSDSYCYDKIPYSANTKLLHADTPGANSDRIYKYIIVLFDFIP